jgi:two-component system phosphate regulon sensor histidine kinase PhoR
MLIRKFTLWKPLLLCVIVNVFFLPISILHIHESIHNTLTEFEKKLLLFDISRIEEVLFKKTSTQNIAELSNIISLAGLAANVRLTLIDMNGNVLVDSREDPKVMDNHSDRPEVFQAMNGLIGISHRFSATTKEYMIYVAKQIQLWDGSKMVFRISKPMPPKEAVYEENMGSSLKAWGLVAFLNVSLFLLFIYYSRLRSEKILQGIIGFLKEKKTLELEPKVERAVLKAVEDMRAVNDYICSLEERIERSNLFFSAFMKSEICGFLVTDQNGYIILSNRGIEKFIGEKATKLVGLNFLNIFRSTKLLEVYKETKVELISREIVEEMTLHDRELKIRFRFTPLSKDGKGIDAILIEIQDVSEIEDLRHIADEFLTNASHEIKTPLTAIKGFVETLKEEGLENKEEALKFIGIVDEQVTRLEETLNGILLLSRLKRRANDLEDLLEEVDLRELIMDVLEDRQPFAREKGVDLKLEGEGRLLVEFIPGLMRQALLNLLDNAIKFSPPGVLVEVGYSMGEGISIWVKDQGPGIGAEERERIFDRFYKGRSKEAQKGTGLGLAIAKAIVELHGGRIELKSQEGKGSTFTIWIPFRGS